MREIKFRGYLKKQGKMLPVAFLNFNGVDDYDVYLASCGDLHCGTCEDPYKLEEVVIMQYTGLKDKNDKEIYEGDIVQGHYIEYDPYFAEDNMHEFTSVVKYIGNSFKVNRDTVNYEGRIRNYGYLHEWDSRRVTVIGNVLENPELLQEES